MHIMSQSEQTIDLTLNAKFIIEFIFSPPPPPKKEDFHISLVLLCRFGKILGLGHKSQLTPLDLCPP